MGTKQYIQHGYTLVELMVVVAIVSIIAAFAAPRFGDMIRNQSITAASTGIVATMQAARSEAIKRSVLVKACFTDAEADFSAPTATTSCLNLDPTVNQNINYLYVFVDANDNEIINGDEELIAASSRFDSDIIMNQDSTIKIGTSIEFNQRGSASFQADPNQRNAYIAICDDRALQETGRLITLSATGRTSLSSIPANSFVACYAST